MLFRSAWLLALHDELAVMPETCWADTVAPLARAIAALFATYLPKLPYPVRSGKHDNTAFSLILALRWARRHDASLAALIVMRAKAWFGEDRDARPWEPGGEDFLSATLSEAVLMRDVLGDDFGDWFAEFLPTPFDGPATCLTMPALVTDRTDGRLAHLDGLNLSRAWCWRTLAEDTPNEGRATAIAERHLAAALPHIADHYMGEHWLATFVVLALSADTSVPPSTI